MGPGPDWLNILIIALLVLAPLARALFQLIFPEERPQRPPAGRPPGGGRRMREVLDEIRREVREPEKAPPSAPAPPPGRRALEPQRPAAERAPPKELRPFPGERAPPRPKPAPRAAAAPTPPIVPQQAERRTIGDPFRPLKQLPQVSFRAFGGARLGKIRKTEFGKIAVLELPEELAERLRREERMPKLLGVDLRRAILLQEILGPPRCFAAWRPRQPFPRPNRPASRR